MSRRLPALLAVAIVLAVVSRVAAEEAKPVSLFNGKDFEGWTFYLSDSKLKLEDVWSVADGAIVCKGKPSGYLRTKDDYQDYVLTLQWRWAPGTTGGNSGVLVHTSTPNALGVWPKSIEVQLAAGNAGDFWVIGTELSIPNAETRRMGRRHLNLTDSSEKAPGEWNTMEITCKENTITVKVNGELVNEATECSVSRGAISLQSEGAEVHFREIKLAPLAKK
jgi:hypothetical protein